MRATWYCVFSAYLWGIETRNSFRSMVKHPVFSLPMRNWNIFYQRYSVALQRQVFSLPMRNWNRYFWAILRQQIRFSAYLWGIETMKVARWQTWLKPFSAYLWGIETKMLRVIRKKLDGFQPTYEELKPVLPLLCFKLCPRFQPTYEELKLGGQQDRQPEAKCFQPTYEELKHFYRYKADTEVGQFSAYLWGIETEIARMGSGRADCFQPTYEELKRKSQSAGAAAHFRFQPTYEELKPNSSNIDSTSFAFSAYLWGIETPFLNLNMCSVRVFSLPMRNWNPSSSFACSTGMAVFSLPMRNWNVAPAAPAWTGSLVFSLPMRNWNCLKKDLSAILRTLQ